MCVLCTFCHAYRCLEVRQGSDQKKPMTGSQKFSKNFHRKACSILLERFHICLEVYTLKFSLKFLENFDGKSHSNLLGLFDICLKLHQVVQRTLLLLKLPNFTSLVSIPCADVKNFSLTHRYGFSEY